MYWTMVIFITDNSDIMELYVDDREDKQRIELLKNSFNTEIQVQRLDYGDILIRYNDKDICIETKTMQDFIGSCNDRRMQQEAINMREAYPLSVIIIYDDGKWNKQYTKPQTLNEKYGNIVSLYWRYMVPVIQCKNDKHFIACIKAIIRNGGKIDEPIERPIIVPKESNDALRIIMAIKNGIGRKTARVLLDTFGTPGGVFKASDDDLDNIPRLQKKSKSAIRRLR